ncbi:MAG: response regulator [Campylobacterales bacterium]
MIDRSSIRSLTKSLSVLYVEDDKSVRDATTDLLRRYAGELEVARNGKEALELFKQRKFDVVITDVNMPVMDGIELITVIRTIVPEQIIILTSAYDFSDFLGERKSGAWANFVLKKPIQTDELLNALTEIGQKKTLASQVVLVESNTQPKQSTTAIQSRLDEMEKELALIRQGISTLYQRALALEEELATLRQKTI